MKTLKLTITAALFLLISTHCMAQKTIEFNDATNEKVNRFFNGQLLLIKVDTAIVLNKLTYSKFQSYPKQVKSLTDQYMSIIQTKDSLNTVKEGYYQQLKSKYDSLYNASKSMADQSSSKLNNIDSSLGKSTTDLNAAQEELKKAQELLAKEQRDRNSKAVKFGLGGLVLGAVIALIIAH